MTQLYMGPFIYIAFDADELANKDNHTQVKLPDGYSYERIYINEVSNIAELLPYQNVRNGDRLTFPPVNSKSPSNLHLVIPDTANRAYIRLSIEKFGQIPDDHYFDKAFDSILVPGDDGKTYPVIPSDQFK